MKYRYFAYCPDAGFETFETEQEAINFAEEAINDFRDHADEGWDENVANVCWGKLEQHTTIVETKTVEEAEAEGIRVCDNAAAVVDYGLVDVEPKQLAEFPVNSVSTPYKNLTNSPTMRKISVWSEGFQATGNSSPAVHHGSVFALSLEEAIKKLVLEGKIEERYVDYNRMTYWGCRFYDNFADASETFG